MSGFSLTIDVAGEQTTAAWDPPADSELKTVFVCAHGAGGQMNDRSMLAVRDALTAAGLGIVRFNFLYRARGMSRPDPMPRLLACWSAVVDHVRNELRPDMLILGGRSMGGRAASVLVANGATCDRLLLLAYPLHPPGATDKLRAEHLDRIAVPVLCFNGTRDAFCERPLMERVVSTLGSNWRMHWLEGADHGFHVLKRSGRTDADILEEVARETRRWLVSTLQRRKGRERSSSDVEPSV
jgi:predicted alpha/beta-hydrolase family hydrolase